MGQQPPQPYHENQLVSLGRALQTLREEDNGDVLIETTLDYLQAEFNYDLIWIGLYDRLEHRLVGKGGITPSGDTPFLKQRFNLNPGDLLEQVVIQQRFLGVPDLRGEIRAGEWRRAAQEFGIQGTMIYPLRCKERCFGVALLGSHRWGVSPRSAEKALLSLLLGGLAAALYQIEVEWQRSAIKRPDQPLFGLLNELMQLPTLAQRLDAVVTLTQQFVAPTRTNLYWYSPERRYFWHRVGNRQPIRRFGELRTNSAGLTVAEVNDFYQALASGQLVAIGAGRSLLSSASTERLLKRLKSRSLLAAPIQSNGELLGFLTVEDNEPRIWEEADRNYARAAAQLIGLVAGSEQIEATLEQAQKDTHFPAEIAQAIARSSDSTAALRDCAGLLCQRLDVERFLVLQEDDKGQFVIVFQQQPLNRRPLTINLPALSAGNQQLLFNSTDALTIEDFDEDLRLFQWRDILLPLGVRSALLVPLGQSLLSDRTTQADGFNPLSLLVIAHGIPRTWSNTQRELVSTVAQQINLLLTVSQLQDSARLAYIAHQTLRAGLSTLSQAPLDPVVLERSWLEYLGNLLECPVAALISWTPESEYATVAAAIVTNPRFAIPPNVPIPIASNPLIQDTLRTNGFLCRSVADLTTPTRQWLSSSGIGQVLAIALSRGTSTSAGILLLADHAEREWPPHLLPPLETLTQQFAWFRHYQQHLTSYTQERENLQALNWYKNRCLETLHQSVRECVSSLLAVEAKISPLSNTKQLNQPDSLDSGEINKKLAFTGEEKPSSTTQPLKQMRRQHLMHQLEQTLEALTPVLKEEQWQLTMHLCPISLAGLLKRSYRRVEPLYKQYQMLLQVHNPGRLSVYADQIKLECILFELLVTSCFHAQSGSWINIWCGVLTQGQQIRTILPTPLSRPLLELFIAENGSLEECLNAVTVSPLEPSPGLHLKICQQIVRSWGGDLQFYQLEGVDGATSKEHRFSSRLLLPLAN
jgi:GAF domain-containing protein